MSDKYVSIVPLTGANFLTWKVHCQMALMKDGLVWKTQRKVIEWL